MAEARGQEYDVDLGVIVGARGDKGAVVVERLTDYPERLGAGQRVWLQPRLGPGRLVEILRAAEADQEHLVIELEGVEERALAERLKGAFLRGRSADSPPLAEGEYYEYQLVGLPVVTTDGRLVGTVDEVLWTRANDVLVAGEHLIPMVREIVQQVDLEAGRIVVEPLPGMLED